MDEVDIDFSGGSHQVFKIGPASVAVPGTTLGLETAHRAFGTLPWAELVAPAAELARRGFELTRPQAYLHAILDLILRHSYEGRRIYGNAGERLVAGDTLRLPDLAGSARPDRRGGRGRGLRRRARARARAGRARGRRHAHRGRPRRLSRDPPPAGSLPVRGPRVPLEPAALGGRSPDRLRARGARPAAVGRVGLGRGARRARGRDGRAAPRPARSAASRRGSTAAACCGGSSGARSRPGRRTSRSSTRRGTRRR